MVMSSKREGSGRTARYKATSTSPSPCLSNMVWKPKAVKVDSVYVDGYNDKDEGLRESMPKIAELEPTLTLRLTV